MRRIALVVLAVLLPSSVSAQVAIHQLDRPRSYDGPPLSLDEAVGTALAQNLDVAATRKQLDVAQLRPAQERALPPPMLGVQIWQWPVNTLNPTRTNFYMPMISQELPGRGKRRLREAVAQKDADLVATDLSMRERDVVGMVKQAYIELLVTRKAIDVHLASVGLLRQIADMSQAKYATGASSQGEVLKGVVEISKLHDDVLMLDEQAQLAAARLNALLNRPLDTSIGPLEELQEKTLVVPLESLRAQAAANRPELTAARRRVERAEAELAVAWQDYKPDFSVQGGYMVMPHQTDALMLQGTFTWMRAPWSRAKLDLHVQEMAARVTAAKAQEAALENQTRLDVDTAYVHAKTAEQRASLLRTTILPQSRQTLDVSRIGYQSGQGAIVDVLDTERILLSSRLDYYKALSDFEQSLADLQRAVGSDIPTVPISGSHAMEVRP